MKLKAAFSMAALALLGACAAPTVVQSVKPGDAGLSCAQLQNEFADAENLKKEADGAKGVTGGNVARLLFWPSIIGTYMNANEAIAAADNRKVNLANLMMQKNCPIPGNNQAADTVPSREARLADLKKLFDANLITKEVYTERQKIVLDTP